MTHKNLFIVLLLLNACTTTISPEQPSDSKQEEVTSLEEPSEEPSTENSIELLENLAANPSWRAYFYDSTEPGASYILDQVDTPFYKLFTEKIFKDCGAAAKIYMLDGQEGQYYFACNDQEFVVGLHISFSKYTEPAWAKDRFTYANSREELGEIKIEEHPWTYTGGKGVSFDSQVFIQEEDYLINIYESAPTKDRYFTEEVLTQWESLKADLTATKITFSTIQNEALYLQAKRSSNNYHVYQVQSNHLPSKWGYYFIKAFDETGNELSINHGQNEYTFKGFNRSVVIDSVKYDNKVRFELWFHSLEAETDEKLLSQ